MFCLGLLLSSVGCLTSQQHASVFQGPVYSYKCTCCQTETEVYSYKCTCCQTETEVYSYKCTCCQTETEVADQTFYPTQSQYTDTGATSLSTDPITPGAWRGSLCNIDVEKNSRRKRESNPSLPLSKRTPLPLDQKRQSLPGNTKNNYV